MPEPDPGPPEVNSGRPWWLTAAILGVLALVAAAWVFVRIERRRHHDASYHVTPLTRLPGKEFQPALSPDGSHLAFIWAQEGGAPPGLWMKEVTADEAQPVSQAPGNYGSPAWSPDGKQIAFLRIVGQATEVVITNTDSGVEGKVTSLTPPDSGMEERLMDWSPDGKWLVVSHSSRPDQPHGLVLVAASNGERKVLTEPGREFAGDFDPRFSPDGSVVSFIRSAHRVLQELYAVPVEGGPPVAWTGFGRQISAHDWDRDGKSVVLASNQSGEFRLWRLAVSGMKARGAPDSIGIYGEFPIQISMARKAASMAFSVLHQDRNIWRLDLGEQTWRRVVASTGQNASPQYSPEGDRICFRSDRSGDEQLWVSQADGSAVVQVTRPPLRASVGRWSPNGNALVFNNPLTAEIFIARESGDGGWNVRSIGEKGYQPVFSPDGQWIYAGGANRIVRIPAAGGAAQTLADYRGLSLAISQDGQALYFTREPNDTSLWRLTLASRSLEKVLDGVVSGCTSCWALSSNGVYYLGTDGKSLDSQVLYYRDFGSGKDRVVLAYPERLWPRGSGPFSLSPDGRYLLSVRMDPPDSDVMLVNPFR